MYKNKLGLIEVDTILYRYNKVEKCLGTFIITEGIGFV